MLGFVLTYFNLYIEVNNNEYWKYPMRDGDVIFSEGEEVKINNCDKELKEAIEKKLKDLR